MKYKYCKNCNAILRRHSLYAYWNSYGIKELRCKECGKMVVNIETAFCDLAEEVREQKK